MKTIYLTIVIMALAICGIKAQTTTASPKAIAYRAAISEKDSVKAIQLCKQFLKDYPIEKTNYKNDMSVGIQYYRIYVTLVTKTKSPIEENIKHYYNVLTYFTVAELYYRQVHLMYQNKVQPPEALVERSSLLIKKMEFFKNNKPLEFADKSDAQWTQMFDNTYNIDIQIHTEILRKAGHTAEGLKYAAKAINILGYNHASLNENYVFLLRSAGEKEKMHQALESAVDSNQVTPAMLTLLKEDYLARGKDDSKFDMYVDSLKSSESNQLKKEITASIIKREIPAFAMYDETGKLVNSKDLKGKVVVLDFFASWCVPCKASFPGMKIAQESFKDDKDVVFYFVDNQEKITDDYKGSTLKYIQANNFPFHILFDNAGDKGETNQVASLLGVSAIPLKMILDKDGFVRFDTGGYMGSPSKLADEVEMMVKITKTLTN